MSSKTRAVDARHPKRSATLAADQIQDQNAHASFAVVEILVPAQVKCMRCDGLIKRGQLVRVTITPGGGPNLVEHPDACSRQTR